MYVDQFSVQSSQRAIQARHSLHSIHAIWGQLALQRTWIIQSRSAGDVAMAYWSCNSLKVPGFVIRISFVNRIFVYSVYGQTEFPFRKPFETEKAIFWNGKSSPLTMSSSNFTMLEVVANLMQPCKCQTAGMSPKKLPQDIKTVKANHLVGVYYNRDIDEAIPYIINWELQM